jgi:hypothetical protein
VEYIYRIQSEDLAFAEEFRQKPVGRHSPGLQRILSLFRGEPIEDKLAILCTKLHKEWRLVQLPGVQGQPIRMFGDKVFHSVEEAEWEIFKLRWKRHTGADLERELTRYRRRVDEGH